MGGSPPSGTDAASGGDSRPQRPRFFSHCRYTHDPSRMHQNNVQNPQRNTAKIRGKARRWAALKQPGRLCALVCGFGGVWGRSAAARRCGGVETDVETALGRTDGERGGRKARKRRQRRSGRRSQPLCIGKWEKGRVAVHGPPRRPLHVCAAGNSVCAEVGTGHRRHKGAAEAALGAQRAWQATAVLQRRGVAALWRRWRLPAAGRRVEWAATEPCVQDSGTNGENTPST